MFRLLVASLLIGAAFAVGIAFGPTAGAVEITKCFGETADINRSQDASGSFLVGTPGHDVIIGSPDRDHIEGRGGRDFICGIGGDDEILGGRRADKLNGGEVATRSAAAAAAICSREDSDAMTERAGQERTPA